MLRILRISAAASPGVCSGRGNQCRAVSGDNPPRAAPSLQSEQVLHSLYRRLRKEGEDRQMMERALSVHSLENSIKYGLRLLHYHTMLVNIDREMHELAFWRLVHRLRLATRRRCFAWRIFILRLWLRSASAISDALVYSLLVVLFFMLYQIYRVCRIGVTRAEERYKLLAVPIKQTFDALEQAQQRRQLLRREMEQDVVQQRH